VVLVKYNSSGTAQWAKTVSGTGLSGSGFQAVAVDGSGNVYAAGYQDNNLQYNYGNGKTITGSSMYSHVVLVKYNSSGTAQWAKTVSGSGSTGRSCFYAVAVDGSGSVYAAGYQSGTNAYNYGTVTAQGVNPGYNVALVKYETTNGTAQWAKSVSGGSSESFFYAVAVDSSSNVYAAGYQKGTSQYEYRPGIQAQGSSLERNTVLVKYNSSGTAQWAKSVSGGSGDSWFYAVAVDSSSNVYAAGCQSRTDQYNYGTVPSPITAQGGSSGSNVALVKYNSSGTAQWAKSVSGGSGDSYFSGAAVFSAASAVYVAGYQYGNGIYTYRTVPSSVTAQGSSTYVNAVLVRYDNE
jgi:hypothetical protein